YSTDGGVTWSPEFLVSDPGAPIDPDIGAPNRFNGPPPTTWLHEYFGIALFGGTAYVAWNGNPAGGSPTRQVYFDAFPLNGALTINGDDGGVATDDTIILRQIATNPGFIEVLVNGQRQYAGLLAGVAQGITINGLGGSDTLMVDFSNGNPIPA